MNPHISLDQWRALIGVVDAGGYAQAAKTLHKSQSAVTYAVQKIELMLNVKVFEIQGRKAILTPIGQMLYRRALALLQEAADVERAAHRVSAGWEATLQLAVEILFPGPLLLTCLDRFNAKSPGTRIELLETVLGGTAEALLTGQTDIAISPSRLPPGFLGDILMRIQTVAVAHPDHPLHALGRPLTYRDLRAHRHVVVRDTGAKRDKRAVSVEAEQRWTVSHIGTSIQAIRMGYGFAWLPVDHICADLLAGTLKPLPMVSGARREVPLHLIVANQDFAGPGVLELAQIIRTTVAEHEESAAVREVQKMIM